MRSRALLIAAGVVFALTIAGGAATLRALLRSPGASITGFDGMIGGVRVVVPAAYVRAAADGGGERVDLVAAFPDFAAAATLPEGGERRDRLIFMTLAAPEDALDPADRTAKLYSRFLEPETWSHPGGLIMRRFRDASPYQGEDLYLAPPEGRAFAARCLRPGDHADGLPETCIAEFRAAGLDARLRFSPARLADWERLDEGARRLVRGLTRR